ncbi:MAG TPA: hypothetical protein VHM16_01720 [Rubrobacteraceae bacterium]|nr:hypothetical protein [Rubrobacteraceae bacterium]
MSSKEAWIGARVTVLNVHGRPEFRGLDGVVEQVYGHPDYRALEVRLENGKRELFWHHELERERNLV